MHSLTGDTLTCASGGNTTWTLAASNILTHAELGPAPKADAAGCESEDMIRCEIVGLSASMDLLVIATPTNENPMIEAFF